MNNFGAQSADYSSFQFSVFSFQIAEIRRKMVRAALPCRPVCPPRCLKREARECTRRAKVKQRSFSQTALFFVLRYFHLSIAARLTRAARGAARTIRSEFFYWETARQCGDTGCRALQFLIIYFALFFLSSTRQAPAPAEVSVSSIKSRAVFEESLVAGEVGSPSFAI